MIRLTDAGRIPQAYGYARVSDQKQADHDESIPGQIARIEKFYEGHLQHLGVQWQGVEFDAFGVSASKIRLFNRPAGARLVAKMKPGDHIIFDKLDRAFRTMPDVALAIEWFKKQEMKVHFMELGTIDYTSIEGEMVIHMMGAVARAESAMKSRRVIERNEWARKCGRPTSGKAPLGTKIVRKGMGRKKTKILIWDVKVRAVMEEIVRLRAKNLSFAEISDIIERDLAAKNGRPFPAGKKISEFFKRQWNASRCRRAWMTYIYYRDHNIQDVCDIPKDLWPTVIAYGRKQGWVTRRYLNHEKNRLGEQ